MQRTKEGEVVRAATARLCRPVPIKGKADLKHARPRVDGDQHVAAGAQRTQRFFEESCVARHAAGYGRVRVVRIRDEQRRFAQLGVAERALL